MDKQALIGALAETGEDQLLLAKICDRLLAGQRKNIPAATAFLSGREQIMARSLADRIGVPEARFFGGTERAERQILCFIPDYYAPEEYLMGAEGPVAALRAEISPYDTLTHRDFLGAILGQGLKREVLGDIYVSERQCDFLVLREMAPYLLRQLTEVGRAKIALSEIPLTEVRVPEQKKKLIKDTVASLRLDSVMAAGFQMGRSRAQEHISAGRVEVNHAPAAKSDREVKQGDILSVRGLGKLHVAEVGGLTKKGRVAVMLERYL